MRRYRVLFVDLDNTLYDWLGYFAPALRGMCVALSQMSGVPVDQLFDDFRKVFVRHETVEYSFALQELESLLELHPHLSREEIVDHYRDALSVFQHRRRTGLHLYPDVGDALRTAACLGVKIVALTDANGFHASMRLRQLRTKGLVHALICRRDHQGVSEAELAQIRRFSAERYAYDIVKYELPTHLRKPDPAVLQWSMERLGVKTNQCVLVGDNLLKDVRMAQRAGVLDCWAAYGSRYNPADLATLLRVTEWQEEAIRSMTEPTPEALGVWPTHTLNSMSDLIAVLTARDASLRTTRWTANRLEDELGHGVSGCDSEAEYVKA